MVIVSKLRVQSVNQTPAIMPGFFMFRMNGYVQDERYIAMEHMDVRRDCVSFAQRIISMRRDCVNFALHVTGLSDIITTSTDRRLNKL